MDFAFTPEQEPIREAVLRLCGRFDEGYWLEKERESRFPEEFYAAMAEGNWFGIAMPEAYGGAGLGIAETAIMM
jgi:acyl-CoA dehydrogenase